RGAGLPVLRSLHAVRLRLHLERQTGGVSRDIERGTRGIATLMSFMLFSIVPTIFEIALVCGLLFVKFDPWYALIALAALTIYIGATVACTEWRTVHRRTISDMDSKATTQAIDPLLTYETVKYFSNEKYEADRYDSNLQHYESAAVKNESSLGVLNAAQSFVIAIAVSAVMWRASAGIVAGNMTLGDLVLINALMVQLYIPLNFLGVMYREIKQALTDMEKMFGLLQQNREIEDSPGALPLDVTQGAAIRFENVDFHYEANRQILHDVSFEVEAGTTVAVVGSSGAGKSTL